MSMMGPPIGSGMSPGMRPGTARVRRGLEVEDERGRRRLPRGLLKRVWRRFARPYLGRLLTLLAAIAGGALIEAFTPRVIGWTVSTISGERDGGTGALNLLVGLLLGLALFGAGLSFLQRYTSSLIGERLILDLRSALYDHVQRMPIAFFTRTQTGALISRLNNDVVGAQRALTGTFGSLAANLIQAIAALAFMVAIEWRLTLLVLAVLPIFVLLAKRLSARLQDLTRQSMDLNAAMNTTMTERFNVAGAMLVKLFGRPREEADAFTAEARDVADIGVRSAMAGRLFFIVLSVVGSVGTALVYWIGGRIALTDGTFGSGDVVAFALLVGRAYAPLAALTNAPVEVLTALVSFERVFEVLDVEPPIADRPGAVSLTGVRGAVVFDHVSFAYPSGGGDGESLERGLAAVEEAAHGPPVLTDVTFAARAGQTIALVGPSGAGKSTMLNLVPRLYDVTGGRVCIDGRDVRDVTLASLSAAVGVVSQDPHLFHDTIAANLRYAKPDATPDELVAACRAARIHEVVAALPDGYETVVGERGYRLSGGEKQRLAIARVLLKDPAVMVLDEATSHLDSENESAIQAALRTARAGRTSLVIAHRLATIVEADLILVVDRGRIVQHGTHAELVGAEGLYAVLYRTQFAAAA